MLVDHQKNSSLVLQYVYILLMDLQINSLQMTFKLCLQNF